MLKKLNCISLAVMVIVLGMNIFARADSQETVECIPEEGDIKSSEAYMQFWMKKAMCLQSNWNYPEMDK